jgi:hypothetical protein
MMHHSMGRICPQVGSCLLVQCLYPMWKVFLRSLIITTLGLSSKCNATKAAYFWELDWIWMHISWHIVSGIFCNCGTSYDGRTGRPLAILLKGYKYNQKECLIEKTENCPMYTWRTSSLETETGIGDTVPGIFKHDRFNKYSLTGNYAHKETLDQQGNWQVCVYWNARLGFFP